MGHLVVEPVGEKRHARHVAGVEHQAKQGHDEPERRLSVPGREDEARSVGGQVDVCLGDVAAVTVVAVGVPASDGEVEVCAELHGTHANGDRGDDHQGDVGTVKCISAPGIDEFGHSRQIRKMACKQCG